MMSFKRLFVLIAAVFMLSAGMAHAANEREGSRVFKTALTGKFPPFSYYNEQGELTGFDVDVSREIARRIGMRPEIIATEWDGILAGLLAGKYDAIIGSMAVTPEREKQVNFSRPYYRSGAQLFVHSDNPHQIYSIEECSGRRIAVVLGETYQHYLEKYYPEIKVVTLKSSVEIFELLEQKRISGFVTDRLVGQWQIKSSGRPFVAVGDMLYEERIAIPVCKQDTRPLEEINKALADMKQDGTLADLHAKYFGGGARGPAKAGGAISAPIAAKKLLRGFGVTMGIAAGSIALGFLLSVPCGLLLTCRKGPCFIPNRIARSAVDFIRGTPVLIQLLFVWMGLGLNPYVAAVLTLGVNAMAYMAEVVRAGLMGVEPGQGRAARALGLSRVQQFRYVVWPQAFRIAIPPLMNSIVALIKDTALVAVISIPEVIREAQSIISVTFEPGKYYLIAAVMFFVVTFPLMKYSGVMEQRIKQKGYAHD